jgi:DNA-binding transcriptional MerR regulator
MEWVPGWLIDELVVANIEAQVNLKSRGLASMDIGDVAKRFGVPASTLRYYEDKGLIASIGRRGLRRRFAPGVLDQLALIALGQAAGFSLDQIASMFSPDGKPSIDRRLLSGKADELDEMIERLKAMSNGLPHAAVCPARATQSAQAFSGCCERLRKACSNGATR